MDANQIFSLPKEFEVTDVEVTEAVLTIYAISKQRSVCCPVGAAAARRVHSRYERILADLPCVGKQVRLLLTVRKFFCEAAECSRKILVERVAPVIAACARVTA